MLPDPDLAPRPARRRVALYSHDTQGLGHIRRNINIAAALVRAEPTTDVLLITGTPEATMLPLPPSTEVLTLPALHKDRLGRYSARVLGASLEEVLALRSSLISAAVSGFAPEVFIVDKVARGVGGELDRPLAELRRAGATRTVLGLRDVLDAPAPTRRDWRGARTTAAVRDFYDAVWIYGDPQIYDAVREYQLPDLVVDKATYTGYLADAGQDRLHARYPGSARLPDRTQEFVLCTVGGGQDGVGLARAFLAADFPSGQHGIVLTGPFMPAEERAQLRRWADRRGDATVHDFVSSAHEFIGRASAAVSMAGYNSVCELLSARCPTLLVPRVRPRSEQSIRAGRLHEAGLVDVLAQDAVTPRRIGGWLGSAVCTGRQARGPIDLAGLTRIPAIAAALAPGGRRDCAVVHACA